MTWVKIIASFILVGLFASGGWWVRDKQAGEEIEKLKREHAEADTKRITDATDKLIQGAETMNTAAINYSKYRLNLKGQLGEISGKIDTIDRPLVVGCKPDDNRVRILYEAVDTVNSSIGSAR